jgi:diguanylate cyclase (GGDEF)-like protein
MPDAQLKRILNNPLLPSLPSVAMEVLRLASQPDMPLHEIARVVQLDQALTGKILKTVNSSYYGLFSPVGSIDRAMAYLGLNTVKTLVLSFSLVDTFGGVGKDTDFDLIGHWRRAIYSATAARLYAPVIEGVEADDAFIAALLQDIGALAMYVTLEDQYAALARSVPHSLLIDQEQSRFGFDHAMVGKLMCERWGLPSSIRAAVEFHHAPNAANPNDRAMLRIIELASLTAELLEPDADDIPLRRLQAKAALIPALAEQGCQSIIRMTCAGAEQLSEYFRVNTGERVDPETLLASAGELLLQHQMQADRRAIELEEANQRLRRATEHDALTDAKNRAFFDTEFARRFNEAQSAMIPLAVLFFDADNFKLINDTHGHLAGDAILTQLVARSKASIGAMGTVCRYGGEEFAVILPGVNRKRAGITAEKLRLAIEASPFDVRGTDAEVDELPVTVSVGVAAFDPEQGHRFADPQQLLHAADKAVYAAKHAGRNCVRVFSPKVGDGKKASVVIESPKRLKRPDIRLLLVEDDNMHAMLIAMMGKSIAGLTIEIAGSGEEAIERLTRDDQNGTLPDAVLCDLGLPGISGFELMAWMRQNLPSALPIVVVTGSEEREDVARCMSAGASAFIGKRTLCAQPRQVLFDIIEEWCIPRKDAEASRAA